METELATDELTDSIAHIEMRRQDAIKESGVKATCNEALRCLHVLLENERAAQQHADPDARHTANIKAVMDQIEKIQKLAAVAERGRPFSKQVRPTQSLSSLPNKPRAPVRNKGRRTMGRFGTR